MVPEADDPGIDYGEIDLDVLAAHYEEAITQASTFVLAELLAHAEDAQLSRARHDDESPNLYEAVAAACPSIDPMRLTSIMWEQVVATAIGAMALEPWA